MMRPAFPFVPGKVLLRVLFLFLWMPLPSALALDRIGLSLESLAAEWGTGGAVELHLDLGGEGRPLGVTLDMQALKLLVLPRVLGDALDLKLVCSDGRLEGAWFRCERLSVQSHPPLPLLSGRVFSLELNLVSAAIRLRGQDLALAGGKVAMDLDWADGHWRLALTGKGLNAPQVLAVLQAVGMPAMGYGLSAGRMDLQWTASSSQGADLQVRMHLSHEALAFSDAQGLRAGEGLKGQVRITARNARGRWMGEVRQSLSAGQVYVEPVLVDADTAALEWKAVFDGDKDRLALRNLVMNQGDFMRIAGSLSWDSGAVTANVDALNLRFPGAFSTWVQPWLLESGLDELETEGDVQVALRYGSQGLEALRTQFQNVYVEDAQGRFALYNLDGNLAWDLRERTQSRLQ